MRAFTLCLARCAYEDINISVSNDDLRTPLHLACATGNLAMVQLLIWVSQLNYKYKHNIVIMKNNHYLFITA